jgi:hypothetical protein
MPAPLGDGQVSSGAVAGKAAAGGAELGAQALVFLTALR